MPEMNAVQTVSAAPVSTSKGELPSGLSQFSSLMNQELNNKTANNAVQVTPDAITLPVQPAGEPETTGDILLGMVNEAVTLNMNGELFAPGSENENSEGTEGLQSRPGDLLKIDSSGENGLKIGAVFFEIFNAFQGQGCRSNHREHVAMVRGGRRLRIVKRKHGDSGPGHS